MSRHMRSTYRRAEPEPVRVDDCVLVRETERALLVLIEGEERWIPKSVATDRFLPPGGKPGWMELQHWFAKKEGLVEE